MELNKEELAKVEADARKEVEAELKQAKKAALKEQIKAKIKEEIASETGTDSNGEPTSLFTIDLPKSCADLRSDGKIYRHGMTYNVTANVKADLQARIAKAWEHHKETRDGESALFFSQPRKRK